MHILLWLSAAHKIRPDDIDKAISAEFPCPQTDPELHAIVTKNMVHGPCGVTNRNSPCMQDGVCKKSYPKCHVESTQQGDDAYPRYRRRSTADGGHVSKLKMRAYGKWMQVEVDNTWVVHYNPWLLRQLHCHVNIEMCTSVKAIKYVLKYVTKGCDQAVISLQQTTHAPICNEIDNFQHGRYVGSSEAAWRILDNAMHAHHPPVVQLAVHLENGQRVYFTEVTAMDKATDPAPRTTLTDLFRLCREDEFACTQLYADLPAFYTWDKAKKVWKRRKTGKPVPPHNVFEMPAIGRVYTVSPRQGECYFLRLLLHVVRGPCSFDDLKNGDGRMCETYREACLQRGLLEDDHHHDDALREAAAEQSTPALRSLFAVIITMCEPSNPIQLWADHQESLCEDFLHRHRQALRDDTAQMNDLILNQCLCDIEAKVLMMGGKSLSHYGLPNPERVAANHLAREYAQHVSYDRDQQAELADDQQTLLTDDQRIVFDSFMPSVEKKDSGVAWCSSTVRAEQARRSLSTLYWQRSGQQERLCSPPRQVVLPRLSWLVVVRCTPRSRFR